ncbi:unnamed protein product [Adineta steineri]|uniref:ADP ribosyltransferase domain-containing protein n=1 Tax=Adineta steineri TaxID=433720 RepID=A0A819WMC5_9BILA|nr:unnamed protein product [Adineta steineri]CAF4128883.1 unnamed protein product [Adineta steineri]
MNSTNCCFSPLLCVGTKISLIDRKENSLPPAVSYITTGGYNITLPMSKLYKLDVWGPYLVGYPGDDRPRRINKENITLIWFDSNMSQDQDVLLEHLRTINDFSLIYTDLDTCINCLKSIDTEKIICVTTNLDSIQILSFANSLTQLDSIFIYDNENTPIENSLSNHPKFAGRFSTWEMLETNLKRTIACLLRHIELFTFYDRHQIATQNVTKKKVEFFWTQLFNDMIHRLPHDQKAKEQMINACRDYYRGNKTVLNKIDEFANTYNVKDCIRWYTKDTFVYKLINKALRTEDMEQLYTFRYFITDLSESLNQEFGKLRNNTSSLILYRGATMSCDEFNILKTNVGFLISTNSYFSTSRLQEIAEIYVGSNDSTSVGVLFEVECDLTKNIIIADVADLSEIPDEAECLFNLGTTFEIVSIQEKNQYFLVKMKATDEQRTVVNDFIQQSREEIEDESLPIVFGILLNKMGLYDKCIRYFKNLLQDSDERNISRVHFHIADAYDNNDEYDMALKHLQLAYKLVNNRRDKARQKEQIYIWLYTSIVLNHMEIFDKSLKYSKKALIGFQRIHGRINHRDIASCLFCMGQSYFGLSGFGCNKSRSAQDFLIKSFEYQQQVLTMQQACLPSDHADIAITLGELSNLFYHLHDQQTSLEYNKKSLDIQKQHLPSDHLSLATSLRNMATSYYEQDDLDTALDYFQQCLIIQRKRLPPMHMEIARTERNIAKILGDKGEVEEAMKHLHEGLPFSQDLFNEEKINFLYKTYKKNN